MRANETRILFKDIRKRQLHFFGQIIWKKQIEHTVKTGKISGKRGIGRLREKILEGLAVWLGEKSIMDMINKAKDWNRWRYMTANVYRQGT
jgi:hypothetical protein